MVFYGYYDSTPLKPSETEISFKSYFETIVHKNLVNIFIGHRDENISIITYHSSA
jgi:hypothetical protein